MIEVTNVLGCLLGGALGDALGYPIEFMKCSEIQKKYGQDGLTELCIPEGKEFAEISDETQLSLFTAEGLIWAKHTLDEVGTCNIASRCFYSYQRWLHTQGYELADTSYEWILDEKRLEIKSPLLSVKELYAKRVRGNTCISALRRAVNQDYGTIRFPINNSKGCGGVIRVAPAGVCYGDTPRVAFEMGIELAAITHSHPTGYLAAGAFCAIIAYLEQGNSIVHAVNMTRSILARFACSEEVADALTLALQLAEENKPSPEHMKEIGKGWVAEEALAIAVYAACCYPDDFKQAVCLAANHDGNSNSTAAICGNIMGTRVGRENLPKEWLEKIECRDVIEKMGEQLYSSFLYVDSNLIRDSM